MRTFKEYLTEGYYKTIKIENIVADRDVMYRTMNDIDRGEVSRTDKKVLTFLKIEGEKGKYQLTDGNHRLFQWLLQGVKQVRGYIELYSDYWAIADKKGRIQFDSKMKYGGLEDLADVEILDDLKLDKGL